MIGKRAARLKVVFCIPDEYLTKMGLWGQFGRLAYIEWFSRPRNKDANHGMYPISRDYRNGVQCAEVVEVDSLFRTCQLVPRFGRRANRAWTSIVARTSFPSGQLYQAVSLHTFRTLSSDQPHERQPSKSARAVVLMCSTN
jgi:hypothetical protein